MATPGAPLVMDKTVPPTTSVKPFPLLKLPQELRDKIYRSLLVFENGLHFTKYFQTGNLVDTQILRTNHQMHAEALDVFLKHNEFNYREDLTRQPEASLRNESGSNLHPRYKQYYALLHESTFKVAPHVRACFYSYSYDQLFAKFARLMAQNPNLTSLHVTFRRLSDSQVIILEQDLPSFETIKVNSRGHVILEFLPRSRARPGMSKRAQKVCKKLKELEEMMLSE
ncbi:hypothetical protein Vi05172_g6469 [Venturia inaequalis]|nr:hypothetical protein Vi05172_g6469 [Venturia inaequalis]